MKILAMDTSAKVTSVALAEDNYIISEFYLNAKITHSQSVMPMLNEALKISNTKLAEIDGFAISNGPGSFTGLRIGISAIKGMAFALDKPIAQISTLEALSYNLFGYKDCMICSVMDARCNQVYTACFSFENNSINRITDDQAISIDELYESLKCFEKDIIFVGDGAELCYNKLKDKLDLCSIASINSRFQRASSVAICGLEKFKNNEIITSKELMPSYLRLSQAERERNLKLNK